MLTTWKSKLLYGSITAGIIILNSKGKFSSYSFNKHKLYAIINSNFHGRRLMNPLRVECNGI